MKSPSPVALLLFIILCPSSQAAPQQEERGGNVSSEADGSTACSREAESPTLTKVLSVLEGVSDMTTLLQEVRRLERKVLKMGKALKKLGLMEDKEGEFVEPTTTTTTTTTTTPVPTTVTTADPGPCKNGWTNIGEGCYQVVTDRALSWEEARQQCLLQGADLAEMNSLEEQRGLIGFLNSWNYGVPFWLGGQRNSRGRWRWEWTESRIQSRAVKWGWVQDYPRSDETFNCLATRGRGQMGGLKTWENLNCDDAHNFICEYLWIQEYLSEEGGTGTMGGENLGLEEKMSRKLEENLVVVEKLRQARALGVQPDEEED